MQSDSPLQVTNENISQPVIEKTDTLNNNGIDNMQHELGEKHESLHDEMDTHGENVIDQTHLDNPARNDDHTL